MDGRFPLAMILLGALLVPSTVAQLSPELTLQVDAPTAPIKPQIENPYFQVTATVRCDLVLRGVSPSQPQAPAQVSLEFQAQNGVVVIGPDGIPVNAQDCAPPATAATVHGAFQLSIPRTAPGLQAIPVVAKARVEGASGEVQAAFTVTADYYSVNQATVVRKLGSCSAPCTLDFPVEVTNFGNARTQYTFELSASPKSGKWNAILPEVLLLDSPNSGQGNATGLAVFRVAVPVGAHEGEFALTITPAAADDPAKVGNPLTVNLLARDTSLASKATPGPALPASLLAVALALVLRRRA